jgi:hypothetical protein
LEVAFDIHHNLISIKGASGIGYTCIDCNLPVFRKNNVPELLRKRDIHFAHFKDGPCSGSIETFLHKAAKEIIRNSQFINLPIGKIHYTEVIIERSIGNLQPDARIITEAGSIAIEVYVTCKKDEDDIRKYKSHDMRVFEIDLSDLDYDSPLEIIYERVIESLDKKKELLPTQENSKMTSPESYLDRNKSNTNESVKVISKWWLLPVILVGAWLYRKLKGKK